MFNNYSRGSEWRRWDLHIHTPGTNKNDQYMGGSLEEKWDNFYKKIDEYVGDGSNPFHDIAAIGITDYLSIDNYKKVLRDNRLPSSIKLVIPNVEFRIKILAKVSPVNLHCLFNPEIVEILESCFFSNLKIEHDHNTYNATKSDLIRFGKKVKNSKTISDEEAYKEGVNKFFVNFDNLIQVFNENKELRENTLIAVSNNSNDGASGITTHKAYIEDGESQLTPTRENIYLHAHFIFSGNNKDTLYFLGKGADKERKIINKYGALKPCVHGSDAHCLERLFEPDKKKYCWIKADPTFNGLCQILYEPESRVRISSDVPDEKNDYQVIDKIDLNHENFLNESIFFNSQLNCIIGGKSTGKSVLLHNIANAIDPDQVTDKNQYCNHEPFNLMDAVVTWRDGSESKATVQDDNHKIIYIPQTYLNRLTDSKDNKTEIDKIVENVLMQDEEKKKLRDELDFQIRSIKEATESNVLDLIQKRRLYDDRQNIKKELGNKEGICKEIERLTLRQSNIKSNDALSDSDHEKYEAALKCSTQSKNDLHIIDNDSMKVEEIKTLFRKVSIDKMLSPEIYNFVVQFQDAQEKYLADKWDEQKKKLLDQLSKNKDAKRREVEKSGKIIKELAVKINESDELLALSKKIQEQNARLQRYKQLEEECKTIEADIEKDVSTLSGTLIAYKAAYDTYIEKSNELLNGDNNSDNLFYYLQTKFRSSDYFANVQAIFDKRSLRLFKEIFDEEDFNLEKLSVQNLRNLISAIISGKLAHKSAFDVTSALNGLLSDYFFISYTASMDNDSMDLMSPGKKALVLLELLINLDQSKCPILIDQPEDDLDNRSIFKELIPFIREKKTQRQIIIVTHNANVVLGGDAEEIIVANQDGEDTPNKEKQFEYRSGSIENDKPEKDRKGNILPGILNSVGIQDHICDILEGGKTAFELRKNKYNMD